MVINLIANDTLIPVVFFVMDNNRNNNLHAGLMDFIIDVTVQRPGFESVNFQDIWTF